MKIRLIVELDNTGDKHRMSLRGECEGENGGDAKDNISIMVAMAILKRRIAKVVDGFPEGITLAEIAEVNNCCGKAVKQ